MNNMYKNGVFGVVVGDAFGCPVQFESREEVAMHPVKDMRGHGTFNLPEGSWTDDSSLTLALLDSINEKECIDLKHIMNNFVKWLEEGSFTPYGFSYDIGSGTMNAIRNYEWNDDVFECGGKSANNNGNGSLMRIMPACLFAIERGLDNQKALAVVHEVGSLTHAHDRANIACGLYYFMVKSILQNQGSLIVRMQKGLDEGFAYYEQFETYELSYYDRLRDLTMFALTPEDEIRSSGYVVDTIEASVWSLINTYSYRTALIKAVNLGLDTDTVGAIAGGLCGLYYGIGEENGIPTEWINKVQRHEWIKAMCDIADERATKRS